MFERFTEEARRVIFFARYEAGQFGAMAIESEHMLLGLLQEDPKLFIGLLRPSDSIGAIRLQVQMASVQRPKTPTNVDLALTEGCKRILAYSAEEAGIERLAEASIGSTHILLGLLREEDCTAAKILRPFGLNEANVRNQLATPKAEDLVSAVPVFRVANVARSIRWYTEVLGFSADPFGDPADPSFACLIRGKVEIMLQKIRKDIGDSRSAANVGRGWDAYIRVNNAHTFHEEVSTKLPDVGPVVKTGYGCFEFTVLDPDGHVIVFGECKNG